jgi:hypothetical protein
MPDVPPRRQRTKKPRQAGQQPDEAESARRANLNGWTTVASHFWRCARMAHGNDSAPIRGSGASRLFGRMPSKGPRS